MQSTKKTAKFTSRNTVSGYGIQGVDIRFSMPQLYAMAELVNDLSRVVVSTIDVETRLTAKRTQAVLAYIIGDLEMPTNKDLWTDSSEEELVAECRENP